MAHLPPGKKINEIFFWKYTEVCLFWWYVENYGHQIGDYSPQRRVKIEKKIGKNHQLEKYQTCSHGGIFERSLCVCLENGFSGG